MMLAKRLHAESLERRDLLAADLGVQIPLAAANDTGSHESAELAASVIANLGASAAKYDLDADGVVAPIDALLAVNFAHQSTLNHKLPGNDLPGQLRGTDDHVDQIGPDATTIMLSGSGTSGSGHAFGMLEQAGDVDVFQFENVGGTDFFLVGLPGVSSLRVQLFDANAQLVAEAESLDMFHPVHIDAPVSPGQYYIVVSASDQVSTGDYLLDLGVTTPGTGGDPVDDHPDQVGPNATEITLTGSGSTLHGIGHGLIETSGDVDAFQFTVPEAGPLEVLMHPPGFASQSMTLVNASTGATTTVSSTLPHEPLHLVEDLPSAGTYYLVVEAADGVTTGDYMFDLLFGTPDDPDPQKDDHANQIGPDATPLFTQTGSTFFHGDGVGVLEDSNDVDVFRFELAGSLQMTAFALPHGFTGVNYAVLDELGNTVFTFSEDLPTEQTLSSGTYYVSVSGATQPNTPFFFMMFGEYATDAMAAPGLQPQASSPF